jgi:hypothetical protein
VPEKNLILTNADGWVHRLSECALACSGSSPRDEAYRLREVFALLSQAPCPSLLAGVALPEISRFESLLRARAYDSAALALLGDDCAMMLSRSNDGHYLASILLPGRSEEMTASGESLSLAVTAALVLAICDMPYLPAELGDEPVVPALRLN